MICLTQDLNRNLNKKNNNSQIKRETRRRRNHSRRQKQNGSILWLNVFYITACIMELSLRMQRMKMANQQCTSKIFSKCMMNTKSTIVPNSRHDWGPFFPRLRSSSLNPFFLKTEISFIPAGNGPLIQAN